jgi:hypothetical protein
MLPVNVSRVQAVDFLVNGDPTVARNAAVEILAQRGFKLNWESDWSAEAVRGTTAGNLLAGPLAEKFVVGLTVTSAANGQSVLCFSRRNSGWMGGWIGALRVSKNMKALREQFSEAMSARGMLAGVQER